jgi:hypothetical protein
VGYTPHRTHRWEGTRNESASRAVILSGTPRTPKESPKETKIQAGRNDPRTSRVSPLPPGIIGVDGVAWGAACRGAPRDPSQIMEQALAPTRASSREEVRAVGETWPSSRWERGGQGTEAPLGRQQAASRAPPPSESWAGGAVLLRSSSSRSWIRSGDPLHRYCLTLARARVRGPLESAGRHAARSWGEQLSGRRKWSWKRAP